jgi:hypothetical protein
MKRAGFERLLIGFVMLVSAGTVASAQSSEQTINVKVAPAGTVEERVANDLKEKELRKAAEEKRLASEANKINDTSPRGLLSRAQILYVSSNTDYFESIQLQNALRKRSEFDTWQMAMIDSWNKRDVADTEIEIDRPLFTFTFTYKITNRNTGIILATGKVTAFDGNGAAPLLAERIVEEIRKARGETKARK